MNNITRFFRRYFSDAAFKSLTDVTPHKAFAQMRLEPQEVKAIKSYLDSPTQESAHPQSYGWWF